MGTLQDQLKKVMESTADTLNLSNELKAAIESNDPERLKKVKAAMDQKLAAQAKERGEPHAS